MRVLCDFHSVDLSKLNVLRKISLQFDSIHTTIITTFCQQDEFLCAVKWKKVFLICISDGRSSRAINFQYY